MTLEKNKQNFKEHSPEKPKQVKSTYSVSGGFVNFISNLNISLAMTSYQSGKLYLLGKNPNGGLNVNERFFKKAMGLYVNKDRMLLAGLYQIHRFENCLESETYANNAHDVCYIPTESYVTGAIDAHDIGVMKNGKVVFVNTRYNCLATTSQTHSFTPIWKPKFISKIIKEDRCHLNGMAMEDGYPRYVTAVSKSDTIDGWRDRRKDGGVVIDVKNNEVICSGLSMPHSPRVYNKKLWVLNSGTGELGFVDFNTEKFEPVVFCPGFTRGLAIHGKYAFVGLSKPRYERFEGLDLDRRLKEADSEPWCGIQVINLEAGTCDQWFRIDGDITEVYDIATISDVSCPMSIGFMSDEIKGAIFPYKMDESFLDF